MSKRLLPGSLILVRCPAPGIRTGGVEVIDRRRDDDDPPAARVGPPAARPDWSASGLMKADGRSGLAFGSAPGPVGVASALVRASPGLARSFRYPTPLGAVSQAACIVGRRSLGHDL